MSDSNIRKDYHLTEYRCTECGQDIYSNRRPDPIHWTDDHICTFEVACCLECSYWDKGVKESTQTDESLDGEVSNKMKHYVEDQIDELNSRINR